jgi:hypothetical protein
MRFALFATAVFACGFQVQAARATGTPNLVFVREYVRELGELEEIRADAQAALKTTTGDPLTEAIHYSTRVQLSLTRSIGMLRTMKLDPPFEDLIGDIVSFDSDKIEIHSRMIRIATQMMSGPKSGVDYGSMAADMPKLHATLESIDETFVKLSTLVFATLIDRRPDTNSQPRRLTITSAERLSLLQQLKTEFGDKLEQSRESHLVSAAGVLKDYLRRDYRSADQG